MKLPILLVILGTLAICCPVAEPDTARTIDTQIKYHLQDVTNWYAFKEAFEKIDPTFFQKLKNKYPNLSEHELRFCAFACSGLDSKQIAFILLFLCLLLLF